MLIKDSAKALVIPREHKFRGDCAVVAHALAYNKSYTEAKKDILVLGLDNYWRDYVNSYPVKDVVIFNSRYVPNGYPVEEVSSPLGNKITTVKRFFESTQSTDVWIVGVREHVFVIKDGFIYDRKGYVDKNSGWLRKVNVAYKIK